MPMDRVDDIKFTDFLRQKAQEAHRALAYDPKQFLRMLGAEGGYATVSKLVSAKNPSFGFETLREHGRLDLSVEALIVETEWSRFFSDGLRKEAERKLRGVGYVFKRYVEPTADMDTSLFSTHDQAGKADAERRGNVTAEDRMRGSRKNSTSFSAHCARLGAPLANVLDRWCGISEVNHRAVFSVWADKLVDGRYVFWNRSTVPLDLRIGAKEMRETIETVIADGYDAYGVLCEAEDTAAEPRKRKYFHEETVLVLRFVQEDSGYVAYVIGELSSEDVASNKKSIVRPFPSAIDDYDVVPEGAANPARISRTANGYRRDDAVRRFVLNRAAGRCEYCGTPGFEMPNGGHYLEAHHVIALADQGPDTVNNVIGLCAHHHREAHFGRDAEKLEALFIERLKAIQG
ncbi:putative restriction endonuclease [Burkholderia pseudomallei]|nr:putative restriction endonuclease [Burkholderia pseudomallei]CAJ5051760.1 putative restriction endonuclease [Burkholderia pseudomallei]